MAKYIDAERLKAEIKALKSRKGFLSFENTEITEAYMARGVQFTCDDIVNIIDSLHHEQPSLPDNLDEAAEKYEDWVESYSQSDFPTCVSFKQAFKAGAEWVAKQGETAEWKPIKE